MFLSDVFRAGVFVIVVVSVVVVAVGIEWVLVQALRGHSVVCYERRHI